MTYQSDFTLPAELLEQIASQGLDFVPELVRIRGFFQHGHLHSLFDYDQFFTRPLLQTQSKAL